MKIAPIDVVIAVAAALRDWDGSPEQAGEKLGAAVVAVKQYSKTAVPAPEPGPSEEAKSLAERIYALRVSLSYTEGVAQIAALLDHTSVQSAPSDEGRAIDREDIVSAMTRAFDSKRMPNRSELHEAAVNLANLFQSAVPAPEASEEDIQTDYNALARIMPNTDEYMRLNRIWRKLAALRAQLAEYERKIYFNTANEFRYEQEIKYLRAQLAEYNRRIDGYESEAGRLLREKTAIRDSLITMLMWANTFLRYLRAKGDIRALKLTNDMADAHTAIG